MLLHYHTYAMRAYSFNFRRKLSFENLMKHSLNGRRGGLMISALDSGPSGMGSGPGRDHCVVFLGKTLYPHGSSLHAGI